MKIYSNLISGNNLQKVLFGFLLSLISLVTIGQNILVDGDFEGHGVTGCNFNQTNAQFNSAFTDLTAFGTEEEICIMVGQCTYGSAPQSGTTKLGVVDFDAFSIPLTTSITGGQTYTLTGYLDSRDNFSNSPGFLKIGVSTSPTAAGAIVGTIFGPHGTVGWDAFSLTFTVPAGTYNYLTVSGDEGSTPAPDTWYHIDNFSLELGSSGPVCDITIPSGGISNTAETCSGGNDGTISVTATSSNPPINYSISGPASASNGTGTFNGLPPGVYTVTVTDALGATCSASGMTTIAPGTGACGPTISQVDSDGDGVPDITDPCSCGDFLNKLDGSGQVTHFHDQFVVTNTGGTGETWQITASTGGTIFDTNLNPITPGTPAAILTEIAPGVYRIDVWHLPGVGMSGVEISRIAGGPPFTFPPQANSCTACAQVPTIGQWGLIILSILILTFGVVALRTRQTVLAGTNTTGSAFNIRQLPFNKKSFGKMLVYVMTGLAAIFTISVAFFGYETMNADVPGSLVAGPLLAYLLHLITNKSSEK